MPLNRFYWPLAAVLALAKLISALAVSAVRPDPPDRGAGWAKHDQVQMGLDFLYRNRVPPDSILLAARSASILLTVLFALALAWWTKRRFGAAAGLLAVALCACDPN